MLATDNDGAHVQICRDRACTKEVTAFDATGSSAAPTIDLPAGTLFWRAFGRRGTATAAASSFIWEFTVGARSAPIDTSWGSTLDVNGDGFADAIVGQRVYLGGTVLSTGASMTLDNIDNLGFDDGGFYGPAGSAGDVNGDGYADFVVRDNGTPYATVAAYVYLGSATGLPTAPSITLNGQVGPTETGSVAGVGDVNGDGYADILVGDGYAGGVDKGAVYLYLGGPSGSSPDAALTITGPLAQFGNSVAGAGDVNGDGYADVVVGDYGLADVGSTPSAFAYVYLGGANGLSATPLVGLTKPDGTSLDGTTAASAGDVNGDGYADLLVGTADGEMGGAYLYLGGPDGPSATPSLTFAGLDGEFGTVLLGAGDVDGDGYGDFVITDPGLLPGGDLPGTPGNTSVAFLYLGGGAGPSTTASFTLVNPSPSDVIGRPFQSWMGAGDVNGDGYGDIAAAALGNTSLGYVFLGSGSRTILPTPSITLE